MAMSTVLPYRIRYASGRGSCTKCGSEIAKGTLTLAIIEQSMTDDCMEPKWFDQDCFFKHRRPVSETLIDGFTNLRSAHQDDIRKLLRSGISNTTRNPMDSDQPPEKKNCPVEMEAVELEREIKKQNKEFFELRGKLKANSKKEDRIAILQFNKQFIPEGNSEILNHLTDILCFGALAPCSMCKDGQMVLKNSIYCCTGNISEWSKCVNTAKTPNRVPVQIPEKYQIFLRGNFKVRARILNDVPKINDEDYELYVKQPLFGMEFMIVSKSKGEIENKIKHMGGNLVEEIHENLAAIISNPAEVSKMGPIMENAKTYGIHVVSGAFIDAIKNTDPLQLIVMYDLSGWGQDPKERLPQMQNDANNLDVPGTSGMSNVQSIKWKYGSVVDPDSKLENVAHVYCDDKLKFYAILDLVDIAANKNSYFKMQLLESDKEQMFWLFVSKGRIATLIGSVDVKPYSNLLEAIAAFKNLYLEKTGNEFGTDVFVKKPGKYNQMNVDHGIEREKVLTEGKKIDYSLSTSSLSPSLFNLIEWLFDVDVMQSALIGFDIDLDKMPLGKISEQQIQSAIKLLKEIESLLPQNPSVACSRKIFDATNQFYSQIPHSFGVQRPPLLNTKEMIEKKFEMLYALQQMDITYSLLSENVEEGRNPIDIHYRTLRNTVEILDLDKQSAEYDEISRYVTNTALSGDNGAFRLELLDVFKVSRRKENETFAPFEGTENRKLLWHGSLFTNFVGILTNGLRIPDRSGMFGKAIYFSDSVSKSANYCKIVNSTDNGLLALCEVALGRCLDVFTYDGFSINNVRNHDTVKAFGFYSPESDHVRPDGLIVPNGELQFRNDQRNYVLTFNEYAVYSSERVKIRYLVKLKFVNWPVGPAAFVAPAIPRNIPNRLYRALRIPAIPPIVQNLPNIPNPNNPVNPPNAQAVRNPPRQWWHNRRNRLQQNNPATG
ncbi:poly [ADP-ribose] polymerase-like isoform X2 [Sitodiplosis mosellana]|uniref:poly [ADP-ribose] polymerase-like isoform X2 n=1 Tax=Sitodiplosis mosellana TaxID=263140 RepID=UPI0024446C99|nr:poly [ADP-ribose] polymerase-like isoform X2 [Sitodiplosis mosellana]XP_055295000.1 poly [ADP-ribose] polymerase-like isoform X2 [Sitodiplosis mosellana]XP_055295001.1 poly [ADP-ribose] polymerase-like isoform X2 [Sitodiplosis mosellana]